MNLLDYAIIGFYLLLTIFLGYFIGGKQKNTEDYFLAGRRMRWWPVAISLFASLFSAISYIAMPGEAYNFGCNMLLGGLTGILALPVALFVFLKFFYQMKLFTVNEYLERRFSPAIRRLNGVLFLGMRLVYLGVVLYATAMLLETALNIPPAVSILLVGGISTLYTCLGGMEAVVWTDVIQFVVLLGGVLLIIGVIARETPGGIGGIWSLAAEHNRGFDVSFDSEIWGFSSRQRIAVWAMLIGLPFAMIGPATDQINLQRCLSCKDFKAVARAVCWSTIGNLPVCFIFYFAGLAVFVYFIVLHPEYQTTGLAGDEAFCRYISQHLPAGLRGLLTAAVLAAVMSTVDSVQNSLSTVFVKDLYQEWLRPGRTEEHYLKAAKLVTLLVGLLVCLFGLTVLAIFHGRDIPLLEVSNICLGILGAFSSVIFVLGLLTYRVNAGAIWVGMAAATPVALYLLIFRYLLPPPEERIGFMYLGMGPFWTALIVGYLSSFRLGGNRPEQYGYVIWSRWKPTRKRWPGCG